MKLHSVQHLRACAALLVVTAHAFSHQIGTDDFWVVLAGRLGVVLFFVISGFIMVTISGTGPFPALDFLKRRIVRIVPLYWFFTVLAASLAAAAPSLFQTTVFTWPHFLQSLFFVVHEAPGKNSVSPLLSLGWTLNYEAYFYVGFALLAAFAAATRITVLSAVFVAAWLVGMIAEPDSPVLRFYLNVSPLAFAVGCWIGWSALEGPAVPERRGAWLWGAGGALGLALAVFAGEGAWAEQAGFLGQILFAAATLRFGLMFEAKMPRGALLERIGDASYALYLSHMFAIGAVTAVAERLLGLEGVFLLSAVSVAVAVAGGLVVHEVVEKPLLRFFGGRRERRGKPALASAMPT